MFNIGFETILFMSVIYGSVVILYTRLVFFDELAHGMMPGRRWAKVGTPEASMPKIILILVIAAIFTPITMLVLLARLADSLKG